MKKEEYELLFHPKQHFITTRYKKDNSARRKLVIDGKHLENKIKHQQEKTDLFITKYPIDRRIQTIILDFDSEDDKSIAYYECMKLKNYLKEKNLNSVIISSGKKGFHLYIQIPATTFAPVTEAQQGNNYNQIFQIFVNYLINANYYQYKTLDEINTNTGLTGNIRLIDSIHGGSNKQCQIIRGEFNKNLTPPNWHHIRTLKKTEQQYLVEQNREKQAEKERQKRLEELKKEGYNDPISTNDLREIIPLIFGGEAKKYKKGYVYVNCFEHVDKNPSMLVTKDFYSCAGCGAKGNIWTLQKKGYIAINKNGEVKTK